MTDPTPAVDFEAAIHTLKERLANDQIGSCSCGKGGIKTPETKYHAPRCAYRMAREQYEAIEYLEAQRPAPSPAAADGTAEFPLKEWAARSYERFPESGDVRYGFCEGARAMYALFAAERAARARAEMIAADLAEIQGVDQRARQGAEAELSILKASYDPDWRGHEKARGKLSLALERAETAEAEVARLRTAIEQARAAYLSPGPQPTLAILDAALAGRPGSDLAGEVVRLRAALEQISNEQKVYKGHGDYDILPAFTADEAMMLARKALAVSSRAKPADTEE